MECAGRKTSCGWRAGEDAEQAELVAVGQGSVQTVVNAVMETYRGY